MCGYSVTSSGVTVLGENCNVKRRKDKLHSFSRLEKVRLYGKNRTKTPRWLADMVSKARLMLLCMFLVTGATLVCGFEAGALRSDERRINRAQAVSMALSFALT